jgi:hypothetical protein
MSVLHRDPGWHVLDHARAHGHGHDREDVIWWEERRSGQQVAVMVVAMGRCRRMGSATPTGMMRSE